MGGRFKLALTASLAVLALALPANAPAQTVQPQVVGGQGVTISQFPWQAALVIAPGKGINGDAFQRQICGGVVLTPNIVISAGHCVADTDPDCGGFISTFPHNLPCSAMTDPGGDGTRKLDPNDADIVLGRTNLHSNEGVEQPLLNDLTNGVTLHPGFNLSTLQHDVSYLVLGSPSVQQTIQIAGPAEGSTWADGVFEDITGWGDTSESSPGAGSPSLMAGSVPIFNVNSCANAYANVGDFVDPATMVCAGYADGGVDSCFGDSGGPMQAPLLGGGYRLVGLTSWGEGCAEPGFPGVYTRVADPTFSGEIQAKIDSLDTALGFGPDQVVGSGAQPRGGGPTFPHPPPPPTSSSSPAVAPAATPSDPFAKCRRVLSKKKRKKCTKKVRQQLQGRP